MKYLSILFTVLICASCSINEDIIKDFRAENDQEIQDYIQANNLNTQKSSSGLYYIIENPGDGERPISTDRVKIAYTGYLTNGEVFDEDDGVSFNLQSAILGWAEGITYLNEGGSVKLIIPSHLAYGNDDFRDVPGGSVVVFDIELIYVNYETENENQIQQYLTDNGISTEKTETGLHYTITTEGDGDKPSRTDNVTLTYRGYFLDDTTFDESTNPITFNLLTLIEGFREGLTHIKEGGSGTLFIPAHLAYGNNGSPRVPGGTVIVFDVELIKIN